mgnify:CR=1 FL=1|nr:5-formyltetrahydrofolate cyclo-ligase [Campylobacter avium]
MKKVKDMLSKDEIRKTCKTLLKKHSTRAFKRDFSVFKEIKHIIKEKKAKNVLIYIPLDYEINLFRFRKNLSKTCNLFVPFMQDKSLKIVKLRLPLYKKRFGILEPFKSDLNLKIDLAVVPVIAVDKNLKRIGHGKGFYDMFFSNLTYKPLVVFIQSLDLFYNENLTQKHDVRADYFINPYKKYFKKEFSNVNNILHIYSRYHRRGDRIFSC